MVQLRGSVNSSGRCFIAEAGAGSFPEQFQAQPQGVGDQVCFDR